MPEKYVRIILPASVRLNIANESLEDGVLMYYVKEKTVRRFCGGCDKHMIDNSCLLLNDNLQGINTLKGFCNASSVDNIKGKMTADGFIPGRRNRHRGTPTGLTLVSGGLDANAVDE
jgi:hypothetical protein